MKVRAIIFLISLIGIPAVSDVNENIGSMVLREQLATISGNTISFNLDLEYSSGITVNQHASWVGLGFDISLPYIDRIPVGSVDEKADTFFCNGPGFYSTKYYRKLLTKTGNGYTQNPDTAWFTAQQDIYTLNADFASGRIVFAQPQSSGVPMQAYLQNWRSFIVKYNIDSTDNISKWAVTTEDGTIYVFGQPVKARINENTGITWFGTDSSWDMTSVWITGMPGRWVTAQVKSADHYVNEKFNRRWYITEIQRPNYDTVTGKGERITFSYTPHNESYQVPIADLNKYASEYDRAATGLFTYRESGHKRANFTFAYDNYYLHPIYPVEITSPTGKIRFVMSSGATDDKLSQGDKRIDKIELYSRRDTTFDLASQIQLNYDATGLAQGHPYSSGGKGLLRLNSIKRLSADGLDTLPVVAFEYGANPSFYPPSCYYKHDFCGYYRSTELRRSSGTFTYPAGQSDTGTMSNPGAEAWSITRVVSGEGRALEYKYEPGIATKVTTNETIATSGSPLRIGIRVKKETISDGISATNIVNTFEYGIGYTDHNFALRHKIDSLYAILNRGQYRNIGNVLVLGGAGVRYEYSIKSTPGSGIVKTHFVNPSNTLPIYLSNPVSNLSMADVYLSDSMSVNSLSQYRGFAWKSESFKLGTSTNPVQSTVANYAIKYDLYSYITPEVVALPLATCDVGGGSGDTTMPEMADNQNKSDFIGFLRLMSSTEIREGVAIRNDVISYNSANGLPNKTRITNSDGKQKLTRITFAFEEKKNDQSLVYQGMKDANMLSQPTETVVSEKAAGNTNTDVLSADVRSAQAIIYSNSLGCNAWVPWQACSWKATLLSNGTPDKTFADFNYVSGASNPNWLNLVTDEKYNPIGQILQLAKPQSPTQISIFRNDCGLPIGSVQFSTYTECGAFTGDYRVGSLDDYWDYDNAWLKGNTAAIIDTAPRLHFGNQIIRIKNDYAAGRNNQIYPGKAYVMTAWVKVISGALQMATSFHYGTAPSGHENDWPVTSISSILTNPAPLWAPEITLASSGGKWVLMKLDIPASATAQLTDNTKKYYARAWVGTDPLDGTHTRPGGTALIAYVDDIRFYPADAMITTTFYDPKWRQPILTVDANDNPSKKVVYDGFGRPIEWRKIDKNNPATAWLSQKKSYHLMGEQ